MVQLSHLDMTLRKIIALTVQTFVIKVTSLLLNILSSFVMGFHGSSAGKESTCNAGDPCLIGGLERIPGERIGYPLQCSCLENPHGQSRLASFSPWGHKESDMIEWLSTAQQVCHSFPSKKQACFNMAAVTIRSNFGSQENKICHYFHFCPLLFAMKWWNQIPWSYFFF